MDTYFVSDPFVSKLKRWEKTLSVSENRNVTDRSSTFESWL